MAIVLLTVLAFLVYVGRSVFITPDRVPFAEHIFWRDSDVVKSPTLLGEIIDGSHTVLMIYDGYSHGRRTTAHASHNKLFMLLPRQIAKGATYSCDPNEDTLYFWGFHGYDFSRIRNNGLADATSVTILRISDEEIVARVNASFYVENGDYGEGVIIWAQSRKGKFKFHLYGTCEKSASCSPP